jgi:nucleoside-diphosphate-sugar epimerase
MHYCLDSGSAIPVLKLTAGEQALDFIYIDDVVSVYDTLAKRHQLDTVQDTEEGSGVAPTIRQFVETAHRLTGSVSNCYLAHYSIAQMKPRTV